jgi:hypothetical protein
MNNNYSLELAAASNDIDAARALATSHGGSLYCDERERWQHLPFRALATVVTDDLTEVLNAADVGLYVVCRRVIKPGNAEQIALFPMVGHPSLSHEEADAHWRDTHAPLALTHHAHMTQYIQLSVVHRIAGLELDGFALCGFASLSDLRDRFFSEEDSVKVIAADIEKFADTNNSPRRLIVTESRF